MKQTCLVKTDFQTVQLALADVDDIGLASSARKHGIPSRTVRHWRDKLKAGVALIGQNGERIESLGASPSSPSLDPPLTFPEIPEEDIPASEIIEMMIKRQEKRKNAKRANVWREIAVNIDGPVGLSIFGDMHVDDNHCNWGLLNRDLSITGGHEAIFGLHVGDAHNNWVGRMARLYGEQDTSRKTAFKLIEHVVNGYGVKWLAWLLGNHDLWTGEGNPLDYIVGRQVTPDNWQARISLNSPNGVKSQAWFSHDFPGHSMWNPNHALGRREKEYGLADLYVAGHKHNFKSDCYYNPLHDRLVHLVRVSGYKEDDDYGERLGLFPSLVGSSVLAIYNPGTSSKYGLLKVYEDLEEGADFLTYLRSKKSLV